jgi:hypothetical protein
LSLLKQITISLGIALLMAALFLQSGRTRSIVPRSAVTPTPDRLAPPAMPETPSQADYGAKEFWSRCLPCHGDRGQGLTDEFRQTYPPEDQNCWMSGCHGARPYENGFKIPTYVPPVIGPNALVKFHNAQVLHDFICAAMPYQWPGTLEDQTCWELTAYLTHQNGLWDAAGELNKTNAAQVVFIDLATTPTPMPASAPTHTPAPTQVTAAAGESNPTVRIVIILAAVVLGLLFVLVVIRRGKSG